MKRKSLNQELYKKIPTIDLIIFSIYSLTEKKKKRCAFEELIKECFVLFPKAIGFQTLTKWPDSRKLDRSLRFLRKKKLIKGSPQAAFSLTKNGKEKARETAKIFGQKKLL